MEKYDIKCYKKPSNVPPTYDVLSVAFFLMPKSYKKVREYVWGLKQLVDHVLNKIPKNYYLYVFHDSTIEEERHDNEELNRLVRNDIKTLLQFLKRHSRVFLFRFNFPSMRYEENSFYHESTFGTFVRFLPLFDYKEYQHLNTVSVLDIDIINVLKYHPTIYTKQFELIEKIPEFPIYFNSHICYDLLYWTRIKRLDKLTFLRIIAHFIGNRQRFPRKLFEDCLKKLVDGTLLFSEDVEHYRRHIEMLHDVNKSKKVKFLFGYDEYFLNAYVLPWIIKNQINFFTIFVGKHSPTHPVKDFLITLEYNTNRLEVVSESQTKVVKKILSYAIKEDIPSSLSVTESYQMAIRVIRNSDRPTIAKRFKDVVESLSPKELKLVYINEMEHRCIVYHEKYLKCLYFACTYDKKGGLQYQCIEKEIV